MPDGIAKKQKRLAEIHEAKQALEEEAAAAAAAKAEAETRGRGEAQSRKPQAPSGPLSSRAFG